MDTPLVMVIFGATGDLMQRKLMPALYELVRGGQVSRNILLVGVGRREISTDQFIELMAKAVQTQLPTDVDLSLWDELQKRIHYVQGTFDSPDLYTRLAALLHTFDTEINACIPRFFYLATPPVHYETILTHLADSKLSEGCGQGTALYTKILIEKPFGRDLETARSLERLLAKTFEERQIYRIDHYLGKETVQNILTFRFANGMFEPTWSRDFIDHVQITLAEDIGVGSRGQLYEGIGAIRDVFQNHILEMAAIIAMDQPRAFDAQSVHDARARVLSKFSIDGAMPVRAQYAGYVSEKNVQATSQTETFLAVKLKLDTPRWRGVPFYVRTGKALGVKKTIISIFFKKPEVCKMDPKDPHTQVCLFPEPDVRRNVLAFTIDPEEGIVLRLMAKKPGFAMKLAPVSMRFAYTQSFANQFQPSPYEKLLLDCIHGDQTLFTRTDSIEASWKLVMEIIHRWEQTAGAMPLYEKGSMGPTESETLIESDDRHWFLGEE